MSEVPLHPTPRVDSVARRQGRALRGRGLGGRGGVASLEALEAVDSVLADRAGLVVVVFQACSTGVPRP